MSRESERAPGTQWVDVSPRDLQAFDTNVAHSARVHDYWLGGKDNYAADRAEAGARSAMWGGVGYKR